jgi:hypothetical protein
VLRQLSKRLPIKLPKDARFNDPHTKAELLLQAHFSRLQLSVRHCLPTMVLTFVLRSSYSFRDVFRFLNLCNQRVRTLHLPSTSLRMRFGTLAWLGMWMWVFVFAFLSLCSLCVQPPIIRVDRRHIP